jgi:hypothetical protein
MNSIYITIFSVVVFILTYAIKNKWSVLDIFFVFLPFKTIQIDFGLMIWIFYIPWVILFFKHFKFVLIFRNLLTGYFFWTLVITVFFSFYYYGEFDSNNSNYLRSSFVRSYISIIKFFVFQISPIFLLSTIIKSHDQIFSALRSYIFGLKILTVIGIAQFLIYFTSGYDFLPFGLTEDFDPLSATEDMIFQNTGFLRISSLGGEPKGLAVSLVIGITMLLYLQMTKIYTSMKLINVWIILMFLVLIATLSTSGFFLILVPLFIVLVNIVYNVNKNILKKIIIMLSFISVLFVFQDLILTIIDARVLSRSSILLSEDIDDSIIKFLEDNPIHLLFGTGLGNIHLHAINYIQDLNLYDLRLNEIFISRYGYLKIMSESGIFGFLLFLLFIIRIKNRILKQAGLISKHMLLIFFLTMFTYYLLRAGYCEVEFYFFTGLIITYLKLCKKEKLSY